MTDTTTAFLSIPGLLKARPAEESGRRFIYLEASNEALGQQGEVVLPRPPLRRYPEHARHADG